MSVISDFFKNLGLNIAVKAIEAEGESQIETLLQKLYDTNPDIHKAAVVALHAGLKPLLNLVHGTASKFDDGIVEAIDQAVSASAEANGITL